ncbi:MAG: hypothetical protein WB783_05235 [Arenicellales bacterium]
MARRVLRWLGVAALVVGYPVLVHHTNESADNGNLVVLVALGPVVLIALVLAWHSAQRTGILVLLGLVCAIFWLGRSVLVQHFSMIYWLQYVGAQVLLFTTFARTLVTGRKPLCTRFAETVHGPLTPRQNLYTRKVTVAWSLFFAAMALGSTLLFFLAPLSVWSIFDNFLTLPLVALMFVAEYWVRRRALPDMQHAHILDSVRAFRDTPARPH